MFLVLVLVELMLDLCCEIPEPGKSPCWDEKAEPSLTTGHRGQIHSRRDIPDPCPKRDLCCSWGMNPVVGTGALLERSLMDP